MSVTIDSRPIDKEDYEWTTIETVLIRIYASLNPNGSFPVHSKVAAGNNVGFDAAVCVQKYEPWVIEAYNISVTSPSILRIVEKGNGNTSSLSGNIRGPPIENTRYLNLSNKNVSFDVAHNNGIYQMLRANVDADIYSSSPTVSSVLPRDEISSNLSEIHRSFLSPMVLDYGATQNSTGTGLLLSALGSVQLTLYHTLWGRDPSSHNRMRMRHWHTPLTGHGS